MEYWKVGPGEADNQKFGTFLLTLRKASGFSRATAAHRLELSSEYIRLIERGVRVPAEGRFARILELYGVTAQPNVDWTSWLVGSTSITFTSRIKEARGEATGRDISPSLSRARRLGLIMQLLVEADSLTLLHVHKLLLSKRDPTTSGEPS